MASVVSIFLDRLGLANLVEGHDVMKNLFFYLTKKCAICKCFIRRRPSILQNNPDESFLPSF
jgi:hypothetical protein